MIWVLSVSLSLVMLFFMRIFFLFITLSLLMIWWILFLIWFPQPQHQSIIISPPAYFVPAKVTTLDVDGLILGSPCHPIPLHRSTKVSRTPSYLQDFHYNLLSQTSLPSPIYLLLINPSTFW